MVGQRKQSNTVIDSSKRSKEKLAQFTQSGEIENAVKQPLILKQSKKSSGSILQLQKLTR